MIVPQCEKSFAMCCPYCIHLSVELTLNCVKVATCFLLYSSFLTFSPVGGSFEANPPFGEELMDSMVAHMEVRVQGVSLHYQSRPGVGQRVVLS